MGQSNLRDSQTGIAGRAIPLSRIIAMTRLNPSWHFLQGTLALLLLIPVPVFAALNWSGNTSWAISDSGWTFGTGNDPLNGILVFHPPATPTAYTDATVTITGTVSAVHPAPTFIMPTNFTNFQFLSFSGGNANLAITIDGNVSNSGIMVDPLAPNNMFFGNFLNNVSVNSVAINDEVPHTITIKFSFIGTGTYQATSTSGLTVSFISP
jgi:hypothetical protein